MTSSFTILEHLIPAAHNAGRISAVEPDGLAAMVGLRVGDILVSVNGHPLRDLIDYRFYTSDEQLTLRVRREGIDRLLQLTKDADEGLGVEFGEAATFDGITECNNHCPFCFVTQLPKGMRRTLHIKDDDYRYSFLYGNFVTLTNLSDDDWQRIADQHLSPLYLSVHSTDPATRAKLLGNRHAPNILEQIDRLAALGVQVHTQLVLCPTINDGDLLEASLHDLVSRFPHVQSISAVPVGLTKIRTERTASAKNPLRRFRADEAARVIAQLKPWQDRCLRDLGTRLVFASDEFYLMAGQRVPGAPHYEGFAQMENGVGLTRRLLDDFSQLLRRLPPTLSHPRHLSLCCATLIAPVLRALVERLNQIANLTVDLHVIENTLFGSEVTVSGLITGNDTITTLRDRPLGDTVVLPRVMFDESGQRAIDDVLLSDIEQALNRPVAVVRGIRALEEILVANRMPDVFVATPQRPLVRSGRLAT